MPRLYDVTSGAVLLDGMDVRKYDLRDLRRQIAYVGQDVMLFDDSIRNNIAFGMEDVADADIVAAARAAHVMEFADELAAGTRYAWSEIAAACFPADSASAWPSRAPSCKNAPILILDEATSALDSESERHVQEALARLVQGRTTLVIAHRLSTVEQADRIIVLDGGRIVESGTHAQLLAQEGLYASCIGCSSMPEEVAGKRAGIPGGALAAAPAGLAVPLVMPTRRACYSAGLFRSGHPGVPVIVIGNVTVGGTGKTPLTLWLAATTAATWDSWWASRPAAMVATPSGTHLVGCAMTVPWSPGTKRCCWPGDPVAWSALRASRLDAARELVSRGCNVILCDDGLQHLALQRDLEIAVVDGSAWPRQWLDVARRAAARAGTPHRRGGPGGGQRERQHRSRESRLARLLRMVLEPDAAVSLLGKDQAPLEAFRGRPVHAVAGIGNPGAFSRCCAALASSAVSTPLTTIIGSSRGDFATGDDDPILMTEKDAVKCDRFADRRMWYVPVTARLPEADAARLLGSGECPIVRGSSRCLIPGCLRSLPVRCARGRC